jgi:hypothetical protein
MDELELAGRVVERMGLLYLFGGPRARELPNLHQEMTGRDGIAEWNPETEKVWECRAELPVRGVAWFGEWLKGRGTFVAARLLPAALSWAGRSPDVEEDVPQAWAVSRDAGLLYEAILSEGPIASVALRRAVGFEHSEDATAYQKALKSLQRGLFITTFGHEQESGAWASSVYEPTVRAFPIHHSFPNRKEGLATLLAAYQKASTGPDPRVAARLFGAPVGEVRSLW